MNVAEIDLQYPSAYFPNPKVGRPVFNGNIYVGMPGTDPLIEANRVSVVIIQQDGTRVTIAPASQPLVTGAGGTIIYQGASVIVKISSEVSVKITDSNGIQTDYFPSYNDSSASSSASAGRFPTNGSFEDETQTGIPANWTLNQSANGTIATDTTLSAHGIRSLKFTSFDATGSGFAISERFDVLENSEIDVRFTYQSSAANTLNTVQTKYYNAAGTALITNTVHTEGAANPLLFKEFLVRDFPPANAVTVEVILSGMVGAGATIIGSTNFDNIDITPLTDNAVVRTQGVVNSVNRVLVEDAITGQNPKLTVAGEDVGLDVEGVTFQNGQVVGDLPVTGDLTVIGDIFAAVARLTGGVTADTVQATTGNSNLKLIGNGSGGIDLITSINGQVLINGIPIRLILTLNTPEEIVTNSGIIGAWTTVSSATLATAGAVTAILRVQATSISTTAQAHIRQTGSGLGVNSLTKVIDASDEGAVTATSGMSEITVNLDVTGQFDWYNPVSGTISIVLVGYYV